MGVGELDYSPYTYHLRRVDQLTGTTDRLGMGYPCSALAAWRPVVSHPVGVVQRVHPGQRVQKTGSGFGSGRELQRPAFHGPIERIRLRPAAGG